MTEKLVVLAWDGLSYQDVVENDFMSLEQLRLGWESQIDLRERPAYFTSELFSDIITGVSRDQHGVRNLKKITGSPRITDFEIWLQENYHSIWFKTRALRESLYKILSQDKTRMKWERGDLNHITIDVDYPESVRLVQVPVGCWRWTEPLKNYDYKPIEKIERNIGREFEVSKDKFYEELGKFTESNETVFFQHFHYIDWLQHLHRSEIDDTASVMHPYFWNVNEFMEAVKETLDNVLDDYTLVVMSDHGVPEKKVGHRPNAFISCSDHDLIPENPTLLQIHQLLKMFASEAGPFRDTDSAWWSTDEYFHSQF